MSTGGPTAANGNDPTWEADPNGGVLVPACEFPYLKTKKKTRFGSEAAFGLWYLRLPQVKLQNVFCKSSKFVFPPPSHAPADAIPASCVVVSEKKREKKNEIRIRSCLRAMVFEAAAGHVAKFFCNSSNICIPTTILHTCRSHFRCLSDRICKTRRFKEQKSTLATHRNTATKAASFGPRRNMIP